MFAIIETGGKQYRVSKDDVIEVERLEGSTGDQVLLEKTLLVNNDGQILIGKPYLTGSSVKVTILDQFRGKKIRVQKMKQRKRYRRVIGHRQNLSKIRVDEINISAL